MPSPRQLSNVSFLVMEDSVHMITIIRSILNGFGVRTVYEAADGAEGLKVLKDHVPDIILCDWQMAPTSGGEFIRTLRAMKDERRATIPVLVISAHTRRTDVVEAMKLGVHGFMAKPISATTLFQHVVTILQKQSIEGPSKGLLPPVQAISREMREIAQRELRGTLVDAETGRPLESFMDSGFDKLVFH